MKRLVVFIVAFLILPTLVACGGGKNSDVSANAHVWNFLVETKDVAVFDPATRTKAICELRPGDILPVIADENGVWTIQSSVFTTEYRVQCPNGRAAWVRETQGKLVQIE